MSILLSVNPPYAGWLVDGEKTIEWRKKPLPTGKAFIYETKKNGGSGKVIGEVDIFNSYYVDVNRVEKGAIADGKVSRFDLQKYAKGKMIGLNLCLIAKRYEVPISLSKFERPCDWGYDCGTCKRWKASTFTCKDEITRPPQSWMYAERI